MIGPVAHELFPFVFVEVAIGYVTRSFVPSPIVQTTLRGDFVDRADDHTAAIRALPCCGTVPVPGWGWVWYRRWPHR